MYIVQLKTEFIRTMASHFRTLTILRYHCSRIRVTVTKRILIPHGSKYYRAVTIISIVKQSVARHHKILLFTNNIVSENEKNVPEIHQIDCFLCESSRNHFRDPFIRLIDRLIADRDALLARLQRNAKTSKTIYEAGS